ncbi:MAG: arsenite methyltransferase, partial [Anaerolineales bacterium]
MNEKIQDNQIHTAVQDHYRDLALNASGPNSCCGSSEAENQGVINLLYEDQDVNSLPDDVTNISLGCGDPVTLASLEVGQTVLDLGSGGGIDCFLASKKVGPGGQVIGVDMTQAMIDRANTNKTLVSADNVDFRLGQIENLPVEDNIVDVIISNCVINLSPDKPSVFSEAYRVLKPGGKLAVSDIVTDGELPDEIKNSLSAWAGCLAGAWDVKDYVGAIKKAGFENIDLKAEYWDDDIIDAAFEQLEPDLKKQVQENKENGKPSLLISSGDGMKLVDYQGDSFDPKKSIFSAKITAWK